MKLVGNFNEPISLNKDMKNVISFQDTKRCDVFIEEMMKYSRSKSQNYDGEVKLITEDFQTIIPKTLNTMILPCGETNIFDSKIFKDALIKRFEHKVFNDENVNSLYNDLEASMEHFLSALTLSDENYQVDFDQTNLIFKKLIGLFKPDYHQNTEDLNSIEKRKLYIDTLVSSEKENILVLLFPESFLGLKDMEFYLKQIRNLDMYVLIITNHPYFIVESDIVNLIKKNGDKVNIKEIQEELLLFKNKKDIPNFERTCRMIAYHEFSQHPYLDDELYINFANKY